MNVYCYHAREIIIKNVSKATETLFVTENCKTMEKLGYICYSSDMYHN